MTFKNLILDFDGTIADTQKSIVQTLKFVAERLNIYEIDETLIKSLIGLPLRESFFIR